MYAHTHARTFCTQRHSGIVLLIGIHYTNTEGFDLSTFSYSYRIQKMNIEYKTEQAEYSQCAKLFFCFCFCSCVVPF